MITFYNILWVDRNANSEEIKNAFKRLVIKYHPDRNNNDELYKEQFILIKKAYEILIDNQLRKDYDSKLKKLEINYKENSSYSNKMNKTKKKSFNYWKKYSEFLNNWITSAEYFKRIFLLLFYSLIIWYTVFFINESLWIIVLFFFIISFFIITYYRSNNAWIYPIIYVFLLNPFLSFFILLYIAFKKTIKDESKIHKIRFSSKELIWMPFCILFILWISPWLLLSLKIISPIVENIYNPYEIFLYSCIIFIFIFFICDVIIWVVKWFYNKKFQIISMPDDNVWIYHILTYITILTLLILLYSSSKDYEINYVNKNIVKENFSQKVEKPINWSISNIDTIEKIKEKKTNITNKNEIVWTFQEILRDVNLRKSPNWEIITIINKGTLIEIYDVKYYQWSKRYQIIFDNYDGYIHNIAFTQDENESTVIPIEKVKIENNTIEQYKEKEYIKPYNTYNNWYSCVRKNCWAISSCSEAYYLLNTCWYWQLDRDKDGIPCETLCR